MIRTLFAATGLVLAGWSLPAAAVADEVTEEEASMDSLPAAVQSTFQQELGGRTPEEIEKISYEGILVLFEAEYDENGEEKEIYVYPSGELAARHEHEGEEYEEDEY